MYIYIYRYIHTHTKKYTNLARNATVRLSYPRSRDSQGQETFLTPSTDKQIRSYDTNAQATIPPNRHKPLGQNREKIKW